MYIYWSIHLYFSKSYKLIVSIAFHYLSLNAGKVSSKTRTLVNLCQTET